VEQHLLNLGCLPTNHAHPKWTMIHRTSCRIRRTRIRNSNCSRCKRCHYLCHRHLLTISSIIISMRRSSNSCCKNAYNMSSCCSSNISISIYNSNSIWQCCSNRNNSSSNTNNNSNNINISSRELTWQLPPRAQTTFDVSR